MSQRSLRIVRVTALAVLLSATSSHAAEPGPSEDRISLEAHIAPTNVSTAVTPLLLCVQNVNRRSGTNQRLVPEDTFVWRIDPGCGMISAASSGCPADLSVFASGMSASDFDCAVTPNAVVIDYNGGGAPKALG